MEYLASAVIMKLLKSCVGPSPIIEITFFSLSICTDELLPTPRITQLLY